MQHKHMKLHKQIFGCSWKIFDFIITGSGKTFTIEGSKDSPGIIPRATQMIFSRIWISKLLLLLYFRPHLVIIVMIDFQEEGALLCIPMKQAVHIVCAE